MVELVDWSSLWGAVRQARRLDGSTARRVPVGREVLRHILNANASREKTNEQKAREFQAWLKIEKLEAKKRTSKAAIESNKNRSKKSRISDRVILPDPESSNEPNPRARDLAAPCYSLAK